MIRFLPVLLFCSSLLPVAAQPADPARVPESRELIDSMADAGKKLNYEGVFVFNRGGRMDVMHMLHKSDASGEREKIVAMTGPAREIIRNNHTVTCVFPDTQEVMIERSRLQAFPAKLSGQIETIVGHYQMETVGSDRIAGRDTWVVSISPKDDFRYGYQLWIDKDTHLLLKSELRDEDGTPLEVAMFTDLEVHDSISDDQFAPSIKGKEYAWYQYNAQVESETADEPGAGGWQVTWMPDGFKLSMHNEKTTRTGSDFLEHLIYSDGVSMVSIFIEKLAAGATVQSGPQKIGGVNVYARGAGDYQVTAVGEVPQATVMRMVDSVVAGQ